MYFESKYTYSHSNEMVYGYMDWKMCSTVRKSEHSGTIGGQMSATWWLLCNAIYTPAGEDSYP